MAKIETDLAKAQKELEEMYKEEGVRRDKWLRYGKLYMVMVIMQTVLAIVSLVIHSYSLAAMCVALGLMGFVIYKLDQQNTNLQYALRCLSRSRDIENRYMDAFATQGKTTGK